MTYQENDGNLEKSANCSLAEAIDCYGFGLFQIVLAFALGVTWLIWLYCVIQLR